MTCFGSLGVGELIPWTPARTIVGENKIDSIVRPPICEWGVRFWCLDLFLVAFCRCFLNLSLTRIRLFHSCTLSLGRALRIKGPRLTFGTEVRDLSNIGDRSIGVIIVTFDVLPSLTPVAEHGIPVILVEATNTLDCVVFLILGDLHRVLGGLRKLNRGRKRAVRVNNRRRKRLKSGRDICHNMADTPSVALWVRG